MMNYQKLQEKLKTYDHATLEKFRITFILFFALVFGVVLQNIVFGQSTTAQNIETEKSVAKAIDTKPKQQLTAVALEAIQTQNTEDAKQETKIEEPEIKTQETTSLASKNSISNYAVSVEANPNFLPIRNYDVADIGSLNSKAAIAVTEDGRVLFKQDVEKKLPIASLTKVMMALVVMENAELDELVEITQNAVNTEGTAGRFSVGEKLEVEDMLKIMLLISSNDAAVALKDHLKIKELDTVSLMNEKAKELGLQNSHFENVVGLDNKENYSSAKDYADLVIYAVKTHPKLLDIFSLRSEVIKSQDPNTKDRKIISNHQLTHDNSLKNIIGGKTGFTESAGGCLMTIFNTTKENGEAGEKVITVILGANDTTARFEESKKLINWINSAYIF